jgi:hypothetical protein
MMAWFRLVAFLLRRCSAASFAQLRALWHVLRRAFEMLVLRPVLAAAMPTAGVGVVGLLWYLAAQRARQLPGRRRAAAAGLFT